MTEPSALDPPDGQRSDLGLVVALARNDLHLALEEPLALLLEAIRQLKARLGHDQAQAQLRPFQRHRFDLVRMPVGAVLARQRELARGVRAHAHGVVARAPFELFAPASEQDLSWR